MLLLNIKTAIKTHKLLAGGILLLLTAAITVGVFAMMQYSNKLAQSSDTSSNNPSSSNNPNGQEKSGNPSPPVSEKSDPSKNQPNKDKNNPKPNPATGQGSANPGTSTPPPSSGGGSTAPQTNCLVNPSACGYPDHTNTGWQHTGVTLTPQTLTSEGELAIYDDGTVIDGKDINGCVAVRAHNVTIKRSRIRCDSYFPIVNDNHENMLVEDVEIDGLGSAITNAGVGFYSYTMRRVDMHNISEGPHQSANVLIEDSYIHDMTSCEICHSDSIQSDGAQNVVIRHNTIINQAFNKNAVLRFATEQGESFNILIENNLLQGGNYIFQIREQGFGFPGNVVIRNNRMGRDWRFGPYDIVGGTITAINNYMDDTLEVVNPDQ